jgi:4-hydroxythreonine-4-phosphate dehydrogenase
LSAAAPVVVTSGEPAGIGPELCARLAADFVGDALVILCDRELFEARARSAGLDIALPDYRRGSGGVSLLHLPAERLGVAQVVMMLVGGGMRVALATTHVPLAEVPRWITRDGLDRTLRILHADLRERFAIASPCIVVAGLNPHAGESGRMGREEVEVIEPVLESLRGEGMTLVGPLPADTLFQPRVLEGADAVLAMYHDQGLPVLKYASFGTGVNITLGLPILRTSVDHGTALDLAGTGRADAGSLKAALDLALDLVVRRVKPGSVEGAR